MSSTDCSRSMADDLLQLVALGEPRARRRRRAAEVQCGPDGIAPHAEVGPVLAAPGHQAQEAEDLQELVVLAEPGLPRFQQRSWELLVLARATRARKGLKRKLDCAVAATEAARGTLSAVAALCPIVAKATGIKVGSFKLVHGLVRLLKHIHCVAS
jgi:hypothetical protein